MTPPYRPSIDRASESSVVSNSQSRGKTSPLDVSPADVRRLALLARRMSLSAIEKTKAFIVSVDGAMIQPSRRAMSRLLASHVSVAAPVRVARHDPSVTRAARFDAMRRHSESLDPTDLSFKERDARRRIRARLGTPQTQWSTAALFYYSLDSVDCPTRGLDALRDAEGLDDTEVLTDQARVALVDELRRLQAEVNAESAAPPPATTEAAR